MNKKGIITRKTIRIQNYDYSTPGYCFITICTKNRKNILSKIYNYERNKSTVGVDAHIDPYKFTEIIASSKNFKNIML